MFEILPETKEAAVAEMQEIMEKLGYKVTEASLAQCFDAAVAVVKRQFGFF